MKTFKEFLQENLEEAKGFETPEQRNTRKKEEHENAKLSNLKPTKIGGWNITTEEHAQSRAYTRFPEKTENDWNGLHLRITKHLNEAMKKKSMDSHEGVYYSRGLKHGITAEVNPNEKHIHITTVLPKGQNLATRPGDVRVMVESVEYEIIFVE